MKILSTYKPDGIENYWKKVDFLPVWLPTRSSRLFYHFKTLIQLIRMRKKYDIYITNSDTVENCFAIIQSIFGQKVKHIMLNCLWKSSKNPILNSLRYFKYRIISRSVSAFLVFATSEIDYYSKTFGIPRQKLKFVPFYYQPILDSGFPSTFGSYIFSGGHHSYRDYETLIEAVKNTNIPCIIATPDIDSFPVKNIPSNVTVSHYNASDYFSLMANSKIVIVPMKPDYGRAAGQRTYLNAMFLGKPVIVCDDSGAYDYIENGIDGMIIQPGDPDALKHAILNISKNENLRINAREKAKKFSMKRTMNEILSVTACLN